MENLKGKIALITGASRGLGKGIALVLAEEGADIVINYHSNSIEAEKTKAEIESLGRKAILIQADVSDKADVDRMFEQIKEQQ